VKEEKLNGVLDKLSDLNVQGMDIMQVRKMLFLDRNKMQVVETNGEDVEKLSSSELKLLWELAKNSRQKIVELSSKLGKTSKTIIAMVKRLQKRGIISSLITEFNPFIYGNDAYLFVITTKSRMVEEKIAGSLIRNNSTGALLNFQNPNIVSFHVVSSLEDLKSLEKTIHPFADDVLSHEFVKVEEQTVYHFFPKGVYEELE